MDANAATGSTPNPPDPNLYQDDPSSQAKIDRNNATGDAEPDLYRESDFRPRLASRRTEDLGYGEYKQPLYDQNRNVTTESVSGAESGAEGKPVINRTISGLEEGRSSSPSPPPPPPPSSSLVSKTSIFSSLKHIGHNLRHSEASDPPLTPSYRRKSVAPPGDSSKPPRKSSLIVKNVEEAHKRRKFVLKLAKALLTFGAPSHRIESQLVAASDILDAHADFVHLPGVIIITIRNGQTTKSTQTYFVRAGGKVQLTSLHKVHLIYRDVLHDRMGAEAGTNALKQLLRRGPIYPLPVRCSLAFVCSAIICILSFGGSIIDMWISGACACLLQYLGLNAANKSSMYANVYEISVTIMVSFVARGLSSIPGKWFCYSSVSSASVVLILPGFTILTSALELMSRNIFCGSVRIVYAIIYTLFLGFGLTIGSDFYLVIDRRARAEYYQSSSPAALTYTHGQFTVTNGSETAFPISGVLGQSTSVNYEMQHVFKGCFRDPSWGWYKQPLPWWTMFFLVPLYSTCSSLSNLQSYRSIQLPVMVLFSCCSYAANKATSIALPDRPDVVAAAGAFVIGCLGNIYSRVVRGTAFTSMVTGVLFLVPSIIAQGGGLTQTYNDSADQYSNGFALALRMISVAAGVTVGLFVSQVIVYTTGKRKAAAHFAF